MLQAQIVRMPPFAPGEWRNSSPLTREQLLGRVILIDFWEYTCVNCIRTLPYLRAWHDRYEPLGLTIIGVHAPEFKFGRVASQVEQAIEEFELGYPILIDNYMKTWDAYANRAWPTKYLIDNQGYIRHSRRGEGGYEETEEAIQQLLRQRDPDVSLPDLMPPLREEDKAGAVCYPATPEIYAGYASGLLGAALGNPSGYEIDAPIVYIAPASYERNVGRFYLGGFWQASAEYVAFAGKEEGHVFLPYEGVTVNAVLSPIGDEVALRLGLGDSAIVEVRQDGRRLEPLIAGDDVRFDETGMSYVTVDRPRMYELVRNPNFGFHDLELIFYTSKSALYSFTLTSCVIAN